MGATRHLADVLAAELHAAGTQLLFGFPGGGASLDVVGAAANTGIGFVLAHDETAACIMAATHGLLTGSVGAAVVTRGPGVTNAATGLAQATLDRFPLLVVSDTVSASVRSRVPHQRLDQVALSAPITKWAGILGDSEPVSVARAAVVLAGRCPAGAVHLDLDPTASGDNPPDLPPPTAVDERALSYARQLMADSRYPVVIAGLEAAAEPQVEDVLIRLGCPVLCTYQGKGVVADSSPVSAGLFTNGALERPILERADLVLAVGVDPVEPIPAPWRYDAPVIMLHPAPVESNYFGAPTIVHGPLKETLPEVIAKAEPRWELDAGPLARRASLEVLEHRCVGLSPHDVVREVMRDSSSHSAATIDAGAHMLVAMPLVEANHPHQVLISNGLATMGFALPAAIGAALAKPWAPVVCFVGDGGLGLTMAELETVCRLDLDIVIVVLNDSALSLIEVKQTEDQGNAGAVRYGRTDFATVARGMGVPGQVVGDLDELRAQLSRGLRGPHLIDARIDPAGYRHVASVTRG